MHPLGVGGFLAAAGMLVSVGPVAAQEGGAPAAPPEQPAAQPPVPEQPAGQPPVPEQPPGEREKLCYPVSRIVPRYVEPHPQHPPIDRLLEAEVTLGQAPEGYVKPREGLPTVTVKLSEMGDRPVEMYCASAIETIIHAINQRLNDLGVVAVVTGISPTDVAAPDDPQDPDYGKDLRPAGETDLHLDIYTGVVSQVRTLAFGNRVPFKERIDNYRHARIKERSPVLPAVNKDDPDRKDLLRKDLLDDYVFRLNRHPGRRVDIAVASGEESGTVTLDYLVAENKPWTLYGQVSNTGTKQTSDWRERVGFIHNQLTGHDDILTIDYITANFDKANAVVASYDAPFFGSQWLRWKAYGNWDEYTASDVGFANEEFTGDSWNAGGELVANVFQHRELFIDVFAGAKFEHIKVTNETFGGGGEDDFFLPYGGVRLERNTDLSSTLASVRFEGNISSVAGTDEAEIEGLGRLGTDADWFVAQWDISHSFYLDPLFFGRRWEDPNSNAATLAHELSLGFKGQYAFDYRLIPNAEQVIGGLYTVRGYPESVSAGDGVLIGTVEYRFHLPNSFKVNPDPKARLFGEPFRWAPQQAYGRADWDLILRGFCDVGRTIISDSPLAEQEETLIGAGVGGEFVFRRNLSVRVDWGIALQEVESSGVSAGSNRFHIVATLLF